MSETEKRKVGRPKGSRNKPKDTATVLEASTVEHAKTRVEDLTDEQRHCLHVQHVRHYQAALAAKQKADADLKNVCKRAKAELGDTAVDDIKLHIRLQSEEGKTALKTIIESQIRIARWNDMPTGHMDDLFPVDRTPHEDRIFADGKKAGMAGEDPTPPHGLNGRDKGKWTEGYHAGQEVNRSILARTVSKGGNFAAHAVVDDDDREVVEEREVEVDLGDEDADEDSAAYWLAKGAEAFQSGEKGTPVPESVPEKHRASWAAGWLNANTAAKAASRKQQVAAVH